MIAGAVADTPTRRDERRLRRFVTAVWVGGAVVMLVAAIRLVSSDLAPDPVHVAAAAVAFALGETAVFRLRVGHDHYSVTWSETALVVGLAFVEPEALMITAPVAVAVAHAAARRPLTKVAFNAAGCAVGIGLATLAVRGLLGGQTIDGSEPTTLIALVIGVFAFGVWNTMSVTTAIALSHGVTPWSLYQHNLGAHIITWAGNAGVGVMLIALITSAPWALVMVPIVAAALVLTYRGFQRTASDRDTWVQLQSISGDLALETDRSAAAGTIVTRLPVLLSADYADVAVTDDEDGNLTRWTWISGSSVSSTSGPAEELAATYWGRATCEQEPFAITAKSGGRLQRDELERLGLAMLVISPLITGTHVVGAMRIGFRGVFTLAQRDLQLFTTFANQVGGVLDNTQLLDTLATERRELADVLEHASDGIASVGADGRVRLWNRAMERISGLDSSRAIGRLPFAGLAIRDENDTELTPPELLERLEHLNGPATVTIQRGDGDTRWLQLTTSDAQGPDDTRVLVAHDITSRRDMESRLWHQALHDELTGLPNRNLLIESLIGTLARAVGADALTAVLFLDLDRFKVINDSLGHHAGDQLLVAVVERLRTAIRPGDLAARFGGDEFVFICSNLKSRNEALVVAHRLAASLVDPFVIEGREVVLTCSVGVAVTHGSDADAAELLRDADAAMYRAKDRGRDRCEMFDHTVHDSAVARLELENEMRQAIERNEFTLHYQPVVSTRTGRIVGVEALARWPHATRGMVMPNEFIPLAEETRLITKLGGWVIEEACRQIAQWNAADRRYLHVAVNLSPVQLHDLELVSRVRAAIERWDIDPSQLVFEITETALVEDMEMTLTRLHHLSDLGVGIALDDFGTGYSALSHLRVLPVDVVKIDRSFICDIVENHRNLAMVEAIIELSHALGATVVAEGIEERVQFELLARMGCDVGQGFLLADPTPPGQIDFERTHELGVITAPMELHTTSAIPDAWRSIGMN